MYNNNRRVITLLGVIFALISCKPVPENSNLEPSVKAKVTTVQLNERIDKAPELKTHSGSYIELTFDSTMNNKWWSESTIYQIWVSSFYDSNNDGYGDLQGIIKKINYIKSLGVEAILLSPIFPSTSYHGYNVTDHKSINEHFGSLADFTQLVDIAHSQGIKIVLDLPVNHTSDQHPWFLQSQNETSKYSDYYVWSKHLPQDYGLPWGQEPEPTKVWHTKESREGWYYGAFGFSNPDLNFKNEAVKSEIKSVFKHWINLGVDGFRIDAARHFVE